MNWQKKNVITNNNNVTLVADPYSASATQYGISHSNNIAASTFGDITEGNTVTGFGISNNSNVRAILVSGCNNHRLNCNIVSSTTHGIEFSGVQPNTSFTGNDMTNHKYGFVLSNNGIIGIQGSNTNPADNRWFGTWAAPNYKTATLSGSSAQNSKMYIRGFGGFNPNSSGFTSSSPGVTDYQVSNGSLIIVSSPSPYLGCPILSGGGNSDQAGIGIIDKQLMEAIALDHISHSINDNETKIKSKNKLYRMLKADPALMDSSLILQTFYSGSTATSRETFVNIEDDISLGDLSNGQDKTNSLVPQNTIEHNYKSFYDLYLKHQTDTLLFSDSLNIVSIANGCPFTDGDAVYQARALFNSVYSTNVYFENSCSQNANGKTVYQNNNIGNNEQFDVIVFPNPGNGKISLIPLNFEAISFQIVVTDIQGKTLFTEDCLVQNGLININLGIPNGMYILRVIDVNGNSSVVKYPSGEPRPA